MKKIIDIEGIGETIASKFQAMGITTTEQLLETGGTRLGRKSLSEKTEYLESLILRWVNHADLMRLKGVGGQHAELLEAAGVDSVVELARRDPANLHAKLIATNEVKHLVRDVPRLDEVTHWIQQAKELPRAVSH